MKTKIYGSNSSFNITSSACWPSTSSVLYDLLLTTFSFCDNLCRERRLCDRLPIHAHHSLKDLSLRASLSKSCPFHCHSCEQHPPLLAQLIRHDKHCPRFALYDELEPPRNKAERSKAVVNFSHTLRQHRPIHRKN